MPKRSIVYILVFALCISAYFVQNTIISKYPVSNRIEYITDSASKVFMVWGLMNKGIPDKSSWPDSSYLEDKMIWSPLSREGNKFSRTIKMPAGTLLYYWMVHKKDPAGNDTDIWDTGGEDKPYFIRTILYEGVFKPGYFIFLAFLLPLLLHFFNHRKEPLVTISKIYQVRDFIPQFDSLRAIAVLLVIVHHWLPEKHFLNFLPNGRLGVNIFFVLSGFLITRILLKAKNEIDAKRLGKGTALKNFYVRRTLRIFPVYYLLLFIFWLCGNAEMNHNGLYYITYTSNYLFYFKESFPANLAHLWSLAVEEQFYILWPWIIILIPRRYVAYIILLFLGIGVSTNFILTEKGWWSEILTPACFDAFAIGGLLSYLSVFRHDIIQSIQPKFKWLLLVVLILFAFDVFKIHLLPPRTTHAMLAILLIYYCLYKNNNVLLNAVLNIRILKWLGKISYGIYLYHLFIPELWNSIIQRLAAHGIDLLYNQRIPAGFKESWLLIQYLGVLVLISIISWKIVEKPINNLKRFFENKKNVPTSVT